MATLPEGKSLTDLSPSELERFQNELALLGQRAFEGQALQPQPKSSYDERSAGTGAYPTPAVPGAAQPQMDVAERAALGGMMFGGGLQQAIAQPGLAGPDPYRPRPRGASTERASQAADTHGPGHEAGRPMGPAEYRERQAKGLKPEGVGAKGKPSYEEFLAAHYPHILEEKREKERKAAAQQEKNRQQEMDAQVAKSLSEADVKLLEALNDNERSQMPAVVDKEQGGRLVKAIEHYTFADGDDTASFYVTFNKDLWEGASEHIQTDQIHVDSKATSLEIKLEGVPVSAKNPTVLADWRLDLKPLFGRVEPLLTTYKVKGGKLSIKVSKAKSGPWKKGVKYS